MAKLDRSDIVTLLQDVTLPDALKLTDSPVFTGLTITDEHVSLVIDAALDQQYADNPGQLATVRADAEGALKRDPRINRCTVVLTGGPAASPQAPVSKPTSEPKKEPPKKAPENKIAHIIAVGSGKGGVGKSTVAANLAVALAGLGKRVGLMDADVYGPSVQHLLGLTQSPKADGDKIEPLEAFGIKAMTMGLLVDQATPMIWRGPMVGSAILQLLNDVAWGTLDVLVVDMPPGTGDAQLTLAQRTPLAGAVIVSTPQDLALIDARKAISMFEKVKVPVLGLIENMSVFICPNCGHESHIFAHGGAKEAAEALSIPFLGHLPLEMAIREASDDGAPVAASADAPQAGAFYSLAGNVLDQLEASNPLPPPRLVMA
ncbi:MAG: Mrp/NBP35 family ATP-binding protein [Pseudomonadota bacterium]